MRRVFLIFSALAYGLLGGGPSLWALGLAQPEPAACSAMGCSCPVGGPKAQGGKKCCCRFGEKLNQKLAKLAQAEAPAEAAAPSAGRCQLRSLPCGPAQDLNGQSLPVQRPHVLTPRAALPLPQDLDRGAPSAAALPFEADLLPPDRPPRL